MRLATLAPISAFLLVSLVLVIPTPASAAECIQGSEGFHCYVDPCVVAITDNYTGPGVGCAISLAGSGCGADAHTATPPAAGCFASAPGWSCYANSEGGFGCPQSCVDPSCLPTPPCQVCVDPNEPSVWIWADTPVPLPPQSPQSWSSWHHDARISPNDPTLASYHQTGVCLVCPIAAEVNHQPDGTIFVGGSPAWVTIDDRLATSVGACVPVAGCQQVPVLPPILP